MTNAHRISADDAFNLLRELPHDNRKLRDVALDIAEPQPAAGN